MKQLSLFIDRFTDEVRPETDSAKEAREELEKSMRRVDNLQAAVDAELARADRLRDAYMEAIITQETEGQGTC